MDFEHISQLWSAKGVIMGHVGDKTLSPGHVANKAFLPWQKTHITTFGALGDLAVDSAYDIK